MKNKCYFYLDLGRQFLAKAIYLLLCVITLPAGAQQGTESSGQQPNINQGAKQGSDSQNLGMAINLAAAGSLAAICATEGGAWACPMAAMALLQAANQAAAAKQSGGVYDATTYKPPEYGGTGLPDGETLPPPTTIGGGDGDGNGGGNGGGGFETGYGNPNINGELKKLENMGYKVNTSDGTITTPDGEYSTEDFRSADAMAAAGMDSGQVASARQGLAALNKQLEEKYGKDGPSVVAMGVSSGGSNGFAGEVGGGGDGGGGSDSMAAYLASLKNKLNKKRGPSSVAGMQKMLGGDPIGVKMDNIFDMIHRRYQLKRKAKVFIESDEDLVPTKKARLPSH